MKFSAFIILLAAAAGAAAQSTTVNVQVSNQINSQVGVKGRLQLAMSTSFQLAGWSYQFFSGAPQATVPLTALYPWHTRVQVISDGIPLTAPGTWDFTELNTMLSPIQASADHSPEFQIGTAPAYMSDANGYILPSSFGDFAQMSANLVEYYNAGGFTAADPFATHLQSSTPYPVTWWGIFNEPNGNGVTAQEYVDLYNTVVPAMARVDPSIKFLAVELSDYYMQAETYLPAFVSGVTAPVDVLATHLYSSCNQRDSDLTVLSTIPGFITEVISISSQLATNPALASVPVWVTENNVNADYNIGNGTSACNPGQPFVTDERGTSPFFAAWRTLVFQAFGAAGVEALYHWSFGTDQQYGEVDASGNPYLSYWVDYYLSHWLPSPPGQDILETTQSGCCAWANPGSGNLMALDTQTMAVRNVDGSIVILMSNYALNSQSDNNGPGTSRTFALDLSALGGFASAALVTLDASTPLSGPVPQSVTPAAQMQVTLPGYGAALLRLSNSQPNVAAVTHAASYATGGVAPGEIVSVWGTGLGPSLPGANLELTNPRLISNALAGVHVLFDGLPAAVTFASAGQINAIVPYAVAGQSSTVLQVEYLGWLSQQVDLAVATTAPGVFTANSSGTGQGAILNAIDNTVNSTAHPAAPGDWVSIFGTGAGATTPAGVDGLLVGSALPYVNASVSVTIGGLPANVNYAGGAPGLVSGVFQINAQVPAGVTPGPSVPLTIKIGGAAAQSGVTLAVAAP